MIATVTKRGQITIPKRVRARMGIEPGSAVEFEVGPDGLVRLFKVAEPTLDHAIDAVRGRLAAGPSTDEVMRLTRGD